MLRIDGAKHTFITSGEACSNNDIGVQIFSQDRLKLSRLFLKPILIMTRSNSTWAHRPNKQHIRFMEPKEGSPRRKGAGIEMQNFKPLAVAPGLSRHQKVSMWGTISHDMQFKDAGRQAWLAMGHWRAEKQIRTCKFTTC
jgi:hypothetical protein